MSRGLAAASILGRLATYTCSTWQASRPALALLPAACEVALGPYTNAAYRATREWHVRSLVTSASTKAAASAPTAAEETREAWRPDQDTSAAPAGSEAPVSPNESTAGNGGQPEMDEVCKILGDMGVTPGRNCVVGDGVAVVDAGLYLEGIKVALHMEENRPSETDAKSYATIRAMQSMLKAHGWHMVVLVASDWRQLDSEQKPNYLAFCINHALSSEHGHGHGGGCCGGAQKHEHGSAGGGCCGGAGGAHKHEQGDGCGGHKHEHKHVEGCGGGHKHEHGEGCGGGHKHKHGEGCGGHKHEHGEGGDGHKHEHKHGGCGGQGQGQCKGDGSCKNHSH